MTDQHPPSGTPAAARDRRRGRLCRAWQFVLDLALILWVVRVPLTFTAVGSLILGVAPQAQDLFVELARATDERIPLFLLLLLFVWAMPTHYSARLLLDTDARFQRRAAELRGDETQLKYLRKAERFIPRALGTCTFIAVLFGIWRSYANLPVLDEKSVIAEVGTSLLVLGLVVLVEAVVFIVYTIKRPRDADVVILRSIKGIARRLTPLWRVVSPGLPDPPGEADSRNVGRLLLLLVFAAFGAVLVFGADWAAEHFPRALAVPLILGGWLPFLSYLSGLGRDLRAPLITGLSMLLVLLTALLGDNHSVRRINADETAGRPVETTRMPLEQAVDLWMQENRCAGAPASCPRPIIVAASGGASRAGFFTATVIGYLMQEAPDHGLDPNDVRRRLFGISSISGSSMGAVMVAAALDAKRDSADHPCVQSDFALWWGVTINNWRDCFEALTTGDFLTPVFIGFAFHDMVRFGWWRDRGAILEDAWQRRYRSVITRADKREKCSGLDCPFLLLRPRSGHWIPLVVLNGTSEAKGNRIVTTNLARFYRPRTPADCPTAIHPLRAGDDCELFAETDHFHDLLSDDTPPEGWLADFQRRLLRDYYRRTTLLDDVRMTTAAHNSARFPLISPPGSVRNRTHEIADRIVDGGYFENYGALGALELALAIRAVQPPLSPFVLVISNDPDDLIDPADEVEVPAEKARQAVQKEQQERRKRADVDDSEISTDIVTPITTIANTRTARGTLAVVQLRSSLRRTLECRDQVTHVRVWPQLRETSGRSRAVSMSWWLSTPIQRHLHQQTEDTKNDNQNGPRLDAIWRALASRSDCMPGRGP